MIQQVPPELVKALGPMAGPAWLLSLTAFGVGLVKAITWLRPMNGNGNGNGNGNMAAVATSLSSSAQALGQIAERLSNVPTKLDLLEAVTEIRHDARNVVTGIQTGIVVEIHDVRDQVLAAIEEKRA